MATLPPHALAVNSGNRKVSACLALFAVLAAPLAGRHAENGTGAMWIAPELVDAATPVTQPCSQSAALHAREIVFETLSPGEPVDDARLLATASREMVRFEWNPSTGELSYDTSAAGGVFSDLATSSRISGPPPSSCGSR
jgi:hypothetical protein